MKRAVRSYFLIIPGLLMAVAYGRMFLVYPDIFYGVLTALGLLSAVLFFLNGRHIQRGREGKEMNWPAYATLGYVVPIYLLVLLLHILTALGVDWFPTPG